MKDVKFWRYYIPTTDGLEGWGVFLLDSTGMFSAVTDYGNYAYMWPIEHTGCDDIRDFFDRASAYYVLGKIAPSRGREYQGDRTEEEIRKTILRLRREGSITEDFAREEWDLLDSIDFYHREGFYEWYGLTEFDDASEYAVYDYNVSERAFAEKLYPRLCEAIALELKAEREQAAEANPEWIKYQCEACERKFAVPDDLEEPACPECKETNCAELGEANGTT